MKTKFIALSLIFSLLILAGSPTAKERRGTELIITKTDGQQVKGELIAVKENSLLLLDSESGADVTVNINEIYFIRIVKKKKAWKYGLVAGGGVGLIAGIASIGEVHGFFATFIDSFIFIGLPVVGIVAIIEGRDKTIQIEGRPESEVEEALDKLRKKAHMYSLK